MTIQEAFDQFVEWRGLKSKPRTINGYATHIMHFCIYLRDPLFEVEHITLDDCICWLQLMRTLGFDENTLQKKAISIKLLFEFLRRKQIDIQFDPDLIPIPKRLFRFPRVATEEGYRKLLSVIPDQGKCRPCYWHVRNKAMIMMLWESGIRNGEMASLGIDDIDTQRMSARIKTEKSRGTIPFREIFWRKETNEALKKWLTAREQLMQEFKIEDSNALFFGLKGGHGSKYGKGKKLEVNVISEVLRKYSNKAGLKIPINPHSLRHHFGRELGRKGANAFQIASMLGHANVASSYPYTMLFGKDREELYREKMGH